MGRPHIGARPHACIVALCSVALVWAALGPGVTHADVGLDLPYSTPSATPMGTGSLIPLPLRSSSPPPEPLVFVDPPYADAWFGWRRSPTSVRVVTAGERVLYRWDSDVGAWQTAHGPISVPEGRHVLHLATVSGSGAPTGKPAVRWKRDVPLKVAFSSPPLHGAPRARSSAVKMSDSDSVVVNATVTAVAGPTLVRLGGRDRYETAVAISKYNFPSSEVVVLATGEGFADALSSSGMAGSYRAPLLLTNRASLPAVTLAEMRRLGAKTCIIAGGTSAVSAAVEQRVKAAGIAVKRLGGADRYATAALIAGEIERRQGRPSLAFVARGDDFPDALAVAPFAYKGAAPIVLTRPSTLPDASRQVFARGMIANVVIAGGYAAVSSGVEGHINGYAGHVSRAGGSDRYETAAKAAETGRAMGMSTGSMVGLATGENFPDALCGGPAVGRQNGVILLTRRGTLPLPTGRLIGDYGPVLKHVEVFGGPAAVSEDVVRALRDIIHW